MLIGHSRPHGIAWGIGGSTGVAALSPLQLDNGRPDRLTRLRWASGTQTTATQCVLTADWAGSLVPGLVLLSNITLPAGTKIDVSFRRTTDPAGTYPFAPALYNAGQRIVAGSRGERTCALLAKPHSTAAIGCRIMMYNDVDGQPGITASQLFEIGEIAICAVTEIDIEEGWTDEQIDTTTFAPTIPGIPYRQLTCTPRAMSYDAWGAVYEPLFARMDRGQTFVCVPSYIGTNGQFSTAAMHATARLATMRKGAQKRWAAGPYYAASAMTLQETPIPT